MPMRVFLVEVSRLTIDCLLDIITKMVWSATQVLNAIQLGAILVLRFHQLSNRILWCQRRELIANVA
ncbi:hypothetical protein D3C81_1589640 [compost metagenome]